MMSQYANICAIAFGTTIFLFVVFCALEILYKYTKRKIRDRKIIARRNCPIETIQKFIDIYDRWSYDLPNKQFIFFTCYYSDEEYQLYKPKVWCSSDFTTFIKIMTKKENLENYTLHTSWH